MNLELKAGMDEHSRDIVKNGQFLGYLQWHRGQAPHIITWTKPASLTLDDLQYILSWFEINIKAKWAQR